MTDKTTMHNELRIAYWNTREGGIDGDDDQRLEQMLEILDAEDLDIICLGEARWADIANPDGNRRLHHVARRLRMTGRHLVPSGYYRCDLAVLVREDKLHVVEERHEHGLPWFHALARLETHLDDFGRLDLVVNHFAPSMNSLRIPEAEAFRMLGKVPVLACGDYNARAERDRVNPAAFRPDKQQKLDASPARIISAAGFIDIGDAAGDLSPTVGWANGEQYRCDRIYHNIPGAKITDYKVITPTPRRPLAPRPAAPGRPARRDLSDHGGVIAGIALPTTQQ